ncbi:MAG: InlB B-repeat-containing protein, partial [Clostridia bacterium]|nr:InlB B-repeat-containing protein [Clostridia bacterium]
MNNKLNKVNRLGRRLLSVILCALLLASTFFVFDPSVLNADAKVSTAANKYKGSIAEQSAYAPETIYLEPGSNKFRYFCNYDRLSGSVGENGGVDSSSVVYFANHDASSIRLFVNSVYQKGSTSDLTSSLKLKVNGSLQSVTGAKVAWNRTSAASGTALMTSNNGEISYQLDSSSGTFNGAEGGVYIIEWVVEYIIGSTCHFAFMYTGIYKPLLNQAGIASFMSYKNEGDNAEMSESFSFLTGAHRYSGGTHRSMMLKTTASGTSPNYAAPLISFVGSGQNSTSFSVPHGENVVPGSSTTSTDAFAVVNNGGVITHYNNSNHESDAMEGRFWGKITNESTLDYETAPTGQFIYNNGTVLDQTHTCGVSYIVVDTSRYSNYNQIPNFSAGWAQYYHQNGKNGNRLDKITNCTVSDSGMSDLDTITCTVDTSSYDDHNDASIARGLYKLNGSIIKGVTHMHFSFVTSWRFKILGIKAITETLNGEHVLAFHTTTVNKSDLREGYADTLNSHVDYANMTAAGTGSDYQSFYNNLKSDAGKLCDPTDHTGASANTATIKSSNGTLIRGGSVLTYETKISTNSSVVSTDDFVCFNVPETIYLTPSTSASTVSFQYVLDQTCSLNSSDLTVTQTPNRGYKAISSGANVYFYYKNAQNVKITYTGATLTGLNNINNTITLSGNNTSLTAAGFTGGSKANSNGYITWTATYLDASDGITKTVTAKTYVYKPFTGVLAASASAVSSHNSSKYQVGISSLMYGVHSIKNSGASGIRIGSGWWGSTGSDGTGSWKQSPMTTAGFSDTNPTPNTWHGNENATALYNVDNTNSYSSTSGGTWWWMGSQRNEGSNIIGGTGRLYIDSKRVLRLGDIPYLSAYIEYGGSSNGDDWRESDCQSYYYIGNTDRFETNEQNSILEHSALDSYSFTRETAATPKRRTDRSYANESISAGNSFVYRAYGHIKRKNGDHHAGDAFTKVDFLNGDKTNLRSAVEYANKYSYALQEKFFDTTSSYWTAYTSALSAAQNALGIVASTENATLATNLTNAVNNLISGNNARSTKTAKQVNIGLKANQDGTYTQIRISPDESLTDFTGTLNSYDRVSFTAENYAGFTYIGCKNCGSTVPSSSALANKELSALPVFDTQSSHSACGEGVTFGDDKGTAVTYGNAVKGNNYNFVYYYLLKPDVLFDNYYDFDAISFTNGRGLSSVTANYAANTLSLTSGADVDCYISPASTRMALTAGHTYRLLYTSEGGSPRATVLPYDSAAGGSYSTSYYKENLASGGTFTVYPGYTNVFVRWGNLTKSSTITYSNIMVQDITNIHGKADDVCVPIPRSKQFTPGDQIGSLSDINRTGYTFHGWFDGKDQSGNGSGNLYSTLTAPTSYKNVYLWSKWTRNSITLTVKPNGGQWNSSAADQSFTQEYSTTKTIANAQRDAYRFKGWDHGGDINGEFDPDTKVFTFGPTDGSRDTLTAQWEPVSYTISFDPNCGGAVSSLTYNIESASTLPTCSRFGYTFSGWKPVSTVNNWKSDSTYSAGASVKGKYGNVTLKAQWKIIGYNVSYDTKGGVAANENPTSYDTTTPRAIINNPSKTGYTFKGWTGSNGTAAQKTVCIPLNQINSSTVLDYSTSNPYTAGSRDHYFGNSFKVTPGEELRILVRAKRTAGARSLNGGIWYGRETGVEGKPYDGVSGAFLRIDNNASSADAVNNEWNYYYKDVTVPATKLTGQVYYQIDQFSSDGFDTTWQLAECAVVKKSDYKDLEFTANWEADEYTMTLDYNGGSLGGKTSNEYKVAYDSSNYYTLNGWGIPSRPGYTFDGFWTSKNGGTRIYENNGECSNDGTYWVSGTWKNTGSATFYAHWVMLSYTVTYKNAEGYTSKAYSVEDSFKLPEPEKTGYTFVSWAQSGNTGNWT